MHKHISATAWGLKLARLSLLGLTFSWLAGCLPAPGKPGPAPEVLRPEQVTDFATLYGTNCAGCHGSQDKSRASIPLANPVYLAFAGRQNLLRISSKGLPGTLMPGFAASAGGMLTDHQVEIIVDGMLKKWGTQDSTPDTLPYAAKLKADPLQGAQSFATYCGKCHGKDGRGISPNQAAPIQTTSAPASISGSIVDSAYLSLISDQALRSYVVAGRPSTNASEAMPDYRNDLQGHILTDQEVTDVIAWMATQRPSSK